MQTGKQLGLILAVALVSQSVAAQNNQGFSGTVSLFAGAASETSNLSVEQDQIQSSYQTARSQTDAVVIPMWDVSYRVSNSELYFKSDLIGMASDFYMQAGYRHYLSDGSALALGWVPGILEKEVWKNPLLLNQIREETKAKVDGLVFNYEQILGSSLSLELAKGRYQVEQEQSASALNRNSDLLYLEVNQAVQLTQSNELEWAVHYLDIDAEGEANAGKRYGLELGWQHNAGRHIFQLGADLSTQEYNDVNPVFRQTREDDRMGISAGYLYAAPFGWSQALFMTRIGWDEVDANIDFYDQEQTLLTAGMIYRF